MKAYRALRNFIHKDGTRVKAGDVVNFPKNFNQIYLKSGIIYATKEEKAVYETKSEATIEHYGAGNYLVKKGNQVIDKVKGKDNAQELADSINDDK